jgi:hypothetical protein
MSAELTRQARKAIQVLQLILQTEEIPVSEVARLLKKKPAWVHENLPVIFHSRKSHSVRLKDLEEYQSKRTVWPRVEFPSNSNSAVYPGRRH